MINDWKINSISPNRVDPWTNSINIVGFAYAAAPFGIRARSQGVCEEFEELKLASSFGIILVKFDFWPKLLGDILEFYRDCLGRTSSQI